ncbi:MAG: SusD protein [Bacteroidetes bacterium]|nr:SusD protein [Bacteroidota bacterium]
MKNIFIIALSVLLFTSCSGFLDEENKAGITNEELYATADGYETLRTNAYANLRTIYKDCPMALLAGTDLYQMPRGTTANGIYDYYNLYDTNSDVEEFYTNCYTALQAINTAVHYLSIADITDANKVLYQNEYDFMKGFIHFILLEEFGGIVINDEYTASPRMNMPRSSLADSYTYIISKLTAALDGSLPQTAKDGHICKDIVNHYLAKVYLTRGWDLGDTDDFEMAKSYAQAVLTSRGDLTESMETLWSPENENNNEVIFAIQYSASSIATTTSGNNQESMFGPYLGGTERGHKYMVTQLYPSWALHSWYAENDARYDATFMLTMWEHYYDYYQSKNVPGTNAITAVYPRAWSKSEEMFNDYLELTGGASNGAFTDVTMSDANGYLIDGALNFIKKWCPEYATKTPVAAVDSKGKNYLRIFPFFEHLSTQMANENYWRSGFSSDFCQPVIKKFDMNQLVVFSQTQSYRDIVLATLSETMLLYAEACIGLKDYSNAQIYINKVLTRPNNSKDGNSLAITLPTTSQEDALETYLKESGKELAGQYCGRWPELRRTGMLKHMYYKYNYDYLTGNFGTDPIGEKLYRPIPQAAIEINDGLSDDDQNPGY